VPLCLCACGFRCVPLCLCACGFRFLVRLCAVVSPCVWLSLVRCVYVRVGVVLCVVLCIALARPNTAPVQNSPKRNVFTRCLYVCVCAADLTLLRVYVCCALLLLPLLLLFLQQYLLFLSSPCYTCYRCCCYLCCRCCNPCYPCCSSGSSVPRGSVQLFKSHFLNSHPIMLEYLSQSALEAPMQVRAVLCCDVLSHSVM
jgi:hypothetical protein